VSTDLRVKDRESLFGKLGLSIMATPVPSASRRPTRTFKDNVRPKSQILIDEKLEAFKDLIEINDDDQDHHSFHPKSHRYHQSFRRY